MGTGRSDGDSEEAPVNVWRRPDGGEVPFHRFCDIDLRSVGDGDTDTGTELRYVRGMTRWGLRFTPVVVGLALLVTVAAGRAAELYALAAILSMPRLSEVVPFVAAGIVWVYVLVRLLNYVDVFTGSRRVVRVAVVYGLLVTLGAGVVIAAYGVTTGTAVPGEPGGPPKGVGFASGFLLMMFLGGHLVYDGMLKTEHMFSHLDEKAPSIIVEPDGDPDDPAVETYADFLEAFDGALDHRLTVPLPDRTPFDRLDGDAVSVRTAVAFAVWFVAPFLASWLYSLGDSVRGIVAYVAANPADAALVLVPTVLDVVLVIVFFQFLVLVMYFNRLLTEYGPESSADTSFKLRYNPTHPDGFAGYRDMGRFATRVNTLLLVGGLYVAFRIYVAGLPVLPAREAGLFSARTLNWGFNYLGPLVVYVLAVAVWSYLSFWQIHKTMRRGREVELRTVAGDDGTELDQQEYELRRRGPVWPINTRLFVSMLSADMLPIVIGLLSTLSA